MIVGICMNNEIEMNVRHVFSGPETSGDFEIGG
jgi:hypothetical protein